MKSTGVIILICVLLVYCSESKLSIPERPIGTESFDELMEIAREVHRSGNKELYLKHVDTSGVPHGILSRSIKALESWTGIAPTMKVKSVSVVSLDDYDPNSGIPAQWPEELKEKFRVNKKELWNITPDKIIIIEEELKIKETELDHEARVQWAFATFSKKGKWFFAWQLR